LLPDLQETFGENEVINVEQVARVCHDANKSYCDSIGDYSQKLWDCAELWQRRSALRGVEYALANPGASASDQHEAWLKDKQNYGWTFGAVKDAEKKTHPCMVPYDQLPLAQRMKDYIFRNIVRAFREAE